MVGVQGFEPWTPCSQSRCATRLRYTPTEPLFYTETAQRGKYCKIPYMKASFLSRLNKHLRGYFALGFLLVSLLGTHWIGFSHGISHSGIQHYSVAQSCADQEPSLSHSNGNCHLFDALTLAGFIATEANNSFSNKTVTAASRSLIISPLARPHIGLYQSRAPPTFLL